ncbi:MAG: ABC transporter ATP-binding protein [Betaproteobacteria bacterium]|nr:ABC transporter ATP-binding protein [Betaproteobacteria bacterium]
MTLLAVRNLSRAFGGVKAVDEVGFELNPGQLLALIGPNGAGKTTCFNLINGQLRPDAGQVLLEGADITGWTPRRIWRQGVGRTFQITATYGSMSVRENVQMVLQSRAGGFFDLRARMAARHREAAQALLEQVGMGGQAERACALLSYGDLKRVELAVALAHGPRVVLMDEPTAGMGPRERDELMALTAKLVTERGIGVLFTEHSMDVVFTYAHRLVVMARGQIIAQGSPDQVRGDPAVQAAYLGSGASYGAAHA